MADEHGLLAHPLDEPWPRDVFFGKEKNMGNERPPERGSSLEYLFGVFVLCLFCDVLCFFSGAGEGLSFEAHKQGCLIFIHLQKARWHWRFSHVSIFGDALGSLRLEAVTSCWCRAFGTYAAT